MTHTTNPSLEKIETWAKSKNLTISIWDDGAEKNNQFEISGRIGGHDLFFMFFLCHHLENDEEMGYPFISLGGEFRVAGSGRTDHANKNYFGTSMKLQKDNSFKTTRILQCLERNWKTWKRYTR